MRVQGNTGIVSGTLDEARRILRSALHSAARGLPPNNDATSLLHYRILLFISRSRTHSRDVLNLLLPIHLLASPLLDLALLSTAGMSAREFRTKIALGVFACVVVGIIIGVIVYVVQQRSGSS